MNDHRADPTIKKYKDLSGRIIVDDLLVTGETKCHALIAMDEIFSTCGSIRSCQATIWRD